MNTLARTTVLAAALLAVATVAGCKSDAYDSDDAVDTPEMNAEMSSATPEAQDAMPMAEGVTATAMPAGFDAGEWEPIGEIAAPANRELASDREAMVKVEDVLANPEQYEGKQVALIADVAEVCEKKGCWANVKDQGSENVVFVKFTCPSEGRILPEDAAGKSVVVVGTVTVAEVSEADRRHMAEDAGATPEEIAAIVGSERQVQVMSDAALVSKS